MILIDQLLQYPGAMTLSERIDYRATEIARKTAIEDRIKRINARRFSGEPVTDFGTLDPYRTDDALAEAMEASK
jgi:hypothetical protein